MRGVWDAVRSVARHADVVLNGVAPLGEIWAADPPDDPSATLAARMVEARAAARAFGPLAASGGAIVPLVHAVTASLDVLPLPGWVVLAPIGVADPSLQNAALDASWPKYMPWNPDHTEMIDGYPVTFWVSHGDRDFTTGLPVASPWWRWTHNKAAPFVPTVPERAWASLRSYDLMGADLVQEAGRRWEKRRLRWPPRWADLDRVGAWPGYLAEPLAPTSSLPPDPPNLWEVRLAGERGEITYPFCRVNVTSAPAYRMHGGYYSVAQALSLECYPSEGADSAERAVEDAARVGDLLTRGFWEGQGQGGRPRRVPLFDYELTTLEQAVWGARLPTDYLQVEDWAPRQLPDPTDQRRVALVVDVRVGWRVRQPPARGGRVTAAVQAGVAGG